MNTTISDGICHQLVEDNITAKNPPGQKLEEQTIAKRFDVSRTPVRDAFRQLVGAGLASSRPHRGVTVANLRLDQINDMFEGLVVDGTIVVGTLFVLAGNLFVLNTREPAAKLQVRAPAADTQHLIISEAKS